MTGASGVGGADAALDALLVDDEESVHATVRHSLPGIELRSAYNLHQGRSAIRKQTPAVVILDLNLPGGSGLRLLEGGVRVSC